MTVRGAHRAVGRRGSDEHGATGVIGAGSTVRFTAWLSLGATPLAAVTVKPNGPSTFGVPDSTPALDRLNPAGSVPDVTEYVGTG